MARWQLVVLFFVGVVGLIFEIFFSPEIRTVLLLTDIVLVGLLPVDFVMSRLEHKERP